MRVTNHHRFDIKCEDFSDNRVRIVLCDKRGKSEYRADNIKEKRVTALRIDGCLIIDGEKCDYLLLVCNDMACNNSDAYFIELKGSDLMKAISQIDRSFDLLKDKLKGFERISARVTLTKYDVPKLRNNPIFIRLSNKLKQHNGDLKYGSSFIEKI